MSRLLLESAPKKTTMTPMQYDMGLYWILRERQTGGWPPRDIEKVSGWLVVRFLAHLANRSPREVAADLIEHSVFMGET